MFSDKIFSSYALRYMRRRIFYEEFNIAERDFVRYNLAMICKEENFLWQKH